MSVVVVVVAVVVVVVVVVAVVVVAVVPQQPDGGRRGSVGPDASYFSQVRPRWPLGPRDDRSRTQAQQLSKRKQPRPSGADGANKRANHSASSDRAIDGVATPSG